MRDGGGSMVYIGGAGRSGSTLTEILLTQQFGFVPFGEVRFLWQYARRTEIRCGCGDRVASCPFWSSVVADLERRGHDVERLASANARINRTRRALLGWPSGDEDLPALTAAFSDLYAALAAAAAGRPWTDSSKAPSQLRLLAAVPNRPIALLHLVRDPRAVAFSWSRRRKLEPADDRPGARMPKRGALAAVLAWAAENALVERAGAGVASYVRVRYEELADRPRAVLKEALGRLDIGTAGGGGADSGPFHTVGGNPLRFESGPLVVRRDEEWRQQLGVVARIGLGLAAGPLRRRYGYALRG